MTKNSDELSESLSQCSRSAEILCRVPKIRAEKHKKVAKNTGKLARKQKVDEKAKRKPKFSKLPDINDDFSDLLALIETPEPSESGERGEGAPIEEPADSSDLNA